MSDSTRRDGDTPAEASAKYRALLGEGEAPVTEARIKFPRHGLHVFHVGDSVTFTDKIGRVHTGPVTEFEKHGAHVLATVRTEDGLMPIEVRRVLPAEFPEAVAMAAKGTPAHLACGTLVRVSIKGRPLGGIADGDLAVVLTDKGLRVNVARLGGAGDSYARVGHDSLTVVTADPRTGALSE
jgi:hypothetical protein